MTDSNAYLYFDGAPTYIEAPSSMTLRETEMFVEN
jgi:hypothetical protein